MNYQKIEKEYDSLIERAKVYYQIIFAINNLPITKSEINLISFCAIKGTISTPPIKDRFSKEYNIPLTTISNMVSKLCRMQILIKDPELKFRINPEILPDFTQPNLVLAIKLIANENNT